MAVLALIGAGGASSSGATTPTRTTVRACVSAKGLLAAPSSAGKCVEHYRGVSLAERGPRGAVGQTGPTGQAGPRVRAQSSFVDTTSSAEDDLTDLTVGPDTVGGACFVGSYGIVYISTTGNGYLHGAVTSLNSGDFYSYEAGRTTNVPYPAGRTMVATGAGYTAQFYAKPSGSSDSAYGFLHLLVDDGAAHYTVDASIFDSPSRCQLAVEVVSR